MASATWASMISSSSPMMALKNLSVLLRRLALLLWSCSCCLRASRPGRRLGGRPTVMIRDAEILCLNLCSADIEQSEQCVMDALSCTFSGISFLFPCSARIRNPSSGVEFCTTGTINPYGTILCIRLPTVRGPFLAYCPQTACKTAFLGPSPHYAV